MYYITISNGLLKDGHRKKMGAAVWEFMWCLDKMTSYDENGVGKVLGGKPIKSSEIAKDLGGTDSSIRKNLSILRDKGYIDTLRTPYGLVITIHKAKKIFQKRSDKISHQSAEMGKNDTSIEMGKNDTNKEDNTAIDKTIDDTSSASAAGKEINDLIELFKEINPNYERLYSNTTQRAALERLVKKFGPEKMANGIKSLPAVVGQKYAPRITTPLQLEQKMGELIAFLKQQRSDNKIGIAV